MDKRILIVGGVAGRFGVKAVPTLPFLQRWK